MNVPNIKMSGSTSIEINNIMTQDLSGLEESVQQQDSDISFYDQREELNSIKLSLQDQKAKMSFLEGFHQHCHQINNYDYYDFENDTAENLFKSFCDENNIEYQIIAQGDPDCIIPSGRVPCGQFDNCVTNKHPNLHNCVTNIITVEFMNSILDAE